MEFFRCCRMCVPPKRHPGCHAGCAAYIADKKLYDEYALAEKQHNKTYREITGVLIHKK